MLLRPSALTAAHNVGLRPGLYLRLDAISLRPRPAERRADKRNADRSRRVPYARRTQMRRKLPRRVAPSPKTKFAASRVVVAGRVQRRPRLRRRHSPFALADGPPIQDKRVALQVGRRNKLQPG